MQHSPHTWDCQVLILLSAAAPWYLHVALELASHKVTSGQQFRAKAEAPEFWGSRFKLTQCGFRHVPLVKANHRWDQIQRIGKQLSYFLGGTASYLWPYLTCYSLWVNQPFIHFKWSYWAINTLDYIIIFYSENSYFPLKYLSPRLLVMLLYGLACLLIILL